MLKAVGAGPVTFRTLDVGGDKLPSAFRMPEGANPALGVRSIRFSLERPDIFRTQLRALYRASASGPVRLMLPLVTGPSELRRALAFCAGVRAELAAEGVAHDPGLPLGAMLETPSAAMTADLLAREVDFFSIGTNDLIQYAFAADRENDDVAHLRNPLQPAVLRLLKQMIDAAAHARVPISICGDMAGDPALTWLLLGLGLRDLSMDPHSIPMVKAIIRRSSLADAEALATAALRSGASRRPPDSFKTRCARNSPPISRRFCRPQTPRWRADSRARAWSPTVGNVRPGSDDAAQTYLRHRVRDHGVRSELRLRSVGVRCSGLVTSELGGVAGDSVDPSRLGVGKGVGVGT